VAKVKELSCLSRVSMPINGAHYTFEFGITMSIDETDNLTDIKKKMHNTCDTEIEKQFKEVIAENTPQVIDEPNGTRRRTK